MNTPEPRRWARSWHDASEGARRVESAQASEDAAWRDGARWVAVAQGRAQDDPNATSATIDAWDRPRPGAPLDWT